MQHVFGKYSQNKTIGFKSLYPFLCELFLNIKKFPLMGLFCSNSQCLVTLWYKISSVKGVKSIESYLFWTLLFQHEIIFLVLGALGELWSKSLIQLIVGRMTCFPPPCSSAEEVSSLGRVRCLPDSPTGRTTLRPDSSLGRVEWRPDSSPGRARWRLGSPTGRIR